LIEEFPKESDNHIQKTKKTELETASESVSGLELLNELKQKFKWELEVIKKLRSEWQVQRQDLNVLVKKLNVVLKKFGLWLPNRKSVSLIPKTGKFVPVGSDWKFVMNVGHEVSLSDGFRYVDPSNEKFQLKKKWPTSVKLWCAADGTLEVEIMDEVEPLKADTVEINIIQQIKANITESEKRFLDEEVIYLIGRLNLPVLDQLLSLKAISNSTNEPQDQVNWRRLLKLGIIARKNLKKKLGDFDVTKFRCDKSTSFTDLIDQVTSRLESPLQSITEILGNKDWRSLLFFAGLCSRADIRRQEIIQKIKDKIKGNGWSTEKIISGVEGLNRPLLEDLLKELNSERGDLKEAIKRAIAYQELLDHNMKLAPFTETKLQGKFVEKTASGQKEIKFEVESSSIQNPRRIQAKYYDLETAAMETVKECRNKCDGGQEQLFTKRLGELRNGGLPEIHPPFSLALTKQSHGVPDETEQEEFRVYSDLKWFLHHGTHNNPDWTGRGDINVSVFLMRYCFGGRGFAKGSCLVKHSGLLICQVREL
jgi:hypothetical protein